MRSAATLPVEHQLYGAVGRIGYAGNGNNVPFPLLIGLRARDSHLEALRALCAVLDIERDELHVFIMRTLPGDCQGGRGQADSLAVGCGACSFATASRPWLGAK